MKTIKDSVFNDCGTVKVEQDHIEVASVYVSREGIRGLTIEEQVTQLRQRLAAADLAEKGAVERYQRAERHAASLLLKLKKLRKRGSKK